MKVTTAMLADAATVADGKLFIHGGGWSSIIAHQMPVTHPVLGLVLVFETEWHESNEDLQIVLELVDADGKDARLRAEMLLRVSPTPLTKKGAPLVQSTAQMFYGLQFDKYGDYRFQVTYRHEVLASVPLNVIAPPQMLPNAQIAPA